MANVTMRTEDVISAKLATCYAVVNGKRFNMMQMKSVTFEFAKNKTKFGILGKTGQANKSTGWSGTFSGSAYYVSSMFRQMMIDYKNTGKDVYFEIQITNEDPTSATGRQTVIFKGCNLDKAIMAKFDASSDAPLEEDVNGTFEDVLMPESFTQLKGMA